MAVAPEWVHYFIFRGVGNKVSEALHTKEYSRVRVHAYALQAANGGQNVDPATGVIAFQQSIDGIGWKTVYTVTDPTSEGEMVVLDPAPYTRAALSGYSAGTFMAVGELYK